VGYVPLRSASAVIGVTAIVIDVTEDRRPDAAVEPRQLVVNVATEIEETSNWTSRFGLTPRERDVFLQLAA
jgi:hypothetical protein